MPKSGSLLAGVSCVLGVQIVVCCDVLRRCTSITMCKVVNSAVHISQTGTAYSSQLASTFSAAAPHEIMYANFIECTQPPPPSHLYVCVGVVRVPTSISTQHILRIVSLILTCADFHEKREHARTAELSERACLSIEISLCKYKQTSLRLSSE